MERTRSEVPDPTTARALVCPVCRAALPRGAGEPHPRCASHQRAGVPPDALDRSDGDPMLGVVVAGRYAVLELRGAGALATVYRAHDLAAAEDVALKVVRADRIIDAGVRERFAREAEILCALRSPYTASARGWGVVAGDVQEGDPVHGALYLVMELLDGESLGQRLGRIGRLEPSEAMRFASHCLRSLAEAHAKGIVHRDLKPDNLLIVRPDETQAEVCRVIDFGLAASEDRSRPGGSIPPSVRSLGASGIRKSLQGTPRYMSPEQAAGLPVDARTDLYSLAVVLYHMLTGRPPFVDRDAAQVLQHHIQTPPPPFAQVAPGLAIPAELEALVMRALAKEPVQRTRSAEVFLQALDNLRRSLDGTGEAAPPGATRRGRGPMALAAVVVVGVAGTLSAIGWGVASQDDSAPAPGPPTVRSLQAAETQSASTGTPSTSAPSGPSLRDAGAGGRPSAPTPASPHGGGAAGG